MAITNKKHHISKKILPRDIPKPVTPKLKPLDEPKTVLAEFRKGGAVPLNLTRAYKGDAPPVQGYTCTAAWQVQHDLGEQEQFQAIAKTLGNVTVLYHGTPSNNITDIASEGLRPGRKYCMFGSGIYLGSPQKAFGYTGALRWGRQSDQKASYMLQVRVALGKVLEVPGATKYTLGQLRHMGYDSVAGVAGVTASWGGSLRHSENVIYSPDQVMVLKVFEYQPVVGYDYGTSTEPTTGNCGIIKKHDVPLAPKARAFKDIMSNRKCGATASVQAQTPEGRIWLCNGCITGFRLKIGSRIQVTNHRNKHIETRITAVL